ncbi:MAG: type 4a pilus biogenesis protein PilO [Gemmatimonadetes bacterium]|nr:type 4a pilus biogenesis protein PilO [Gemmatimonadota bacterium]
MASLPTNQRDQIMLFVGVLGILGAGAYWNWVYSPKSEKIEETRTHVEALDASNQRAKSIMARGSVEQLQAESKRLQANLDLMRTLIPTGNEVPALLEQMLGAARRTGLEISGFTPGATVQGETFDTMKYRMSMQGSYHQIGALLTAVGSLRRIIVPMNVSLVPSSTREARANAPEERILTAQFDIQTYVSKTGTEGDR